MAPKIPSSKASAPDLEILGNKVTLHPGGYVEPPNHAGPERNLVEHMAHFRESPLDFLREVSMYVSGTGWRAYDDVIGQPVYYKGFTENMKTQVLSTPMLKARIDQLAEERTMVEEKMGLFGDEAEKRAKRRKREEELKQNLVDVASEIVDNMICKMESKPFIRSAYYLATQLLTRAYHQGIHVSSEEVLRLRAVAETAEKEKKSIVFLPCHKSHVDYVSLQLICYRLGIALPTVVAGDNLGFIGVKQFLQRAGAMWIRRSFAGDVLYSTCVQAYIDTLLRLGYHLEAFVEGGRSRTGKLLPPKFGILSYVMDAVISGRVDDAIICPVSTQYDKVIETEGYISELLGQPKQKENIIDFLNSSSVLSLKLGRVDVRFQEPWSLKGFIAGQQARASKVPQQIQVATNNASSDARVRLLRTMGYKVLSDINAVSVVMPTALIGTVLLTLRGRGVGKSELVRRVNWLRQRVTANGGRVAHFSGQPTSVVVDRALEVLGPRLVGKVDGLAEETYYAVDRFQLSFYRNMTIHLFISEALVCVSMYTRVKRGGGPDQQRILYEDLYNQVSFFSQLFQQEFIYPTEGLRANLQKTLNDLEAAQVIKLSRDANGATVAAELSDIERSRGREDFDFYCFLIWPYVESNWLAATWLMALTAPTSQQSEEWVGLKKAQDMAQLFGKTLYHQGDLSYYEAVNKETLKNAYQRFEDEGIILTAKSRDAKIPTMCKLSPAWTPQRDEQGRVKPEGRLWDFTETIAKSRREGKNRRDGATVSTRVLSLVDQMGRDLFAEATAQPGESKVVNPTRKRQRREIQTKALL